MNFDPADLFILVSTLQGIVLGTVVLLVPAYRSPANRYLGGSLLLLSAILFLGWQEFGVDWIDWVWSIMWEYLFAALIFTYFLRALGHPFYWSPWRKWLFAPFVLSVVIDLTLDLDFVFGVYDLPVSAQNQHVRVYDAFEDHLALWLNALAMLAVFVLTVTERRAPAPRRRWLLRFCLGMAGVVVVWFFSDVVQAGYGIPDPWSLIWIAVSALLWWVGYEGLYLRRIVEEPAAPPSDRKETEDPAEGYGREIVRLMAEEKWFRNPDLGRQQFAAELDISEAYVSRVLRDRIGSGLAEFVNHYRITEATALLDDPAYAAYSLEAIGLEAGFKSRSAFYTAFKKATGTTPGAYRKQLQTS